MPILVDCLCGRKLRVRDDYAGKQGHCPACGRAVDIPDLNRPAAHFVSSEPLSPTVFVTAEPVEQAATEPIPRLPLSPKDLPVTGLRRQGLRMVVGVLAVAFLGLIIFFGRGLLPGSPAGFFF
jgi:hypothetical protein